MNNFKFNAPKSIRFGCGLLSAIGDIVSTEIGNRVMLVTDPGLMATGIVDRALRSLRLAGVDVKLYKDVVADPPDTLILLAVEEAKDFAAKGVIGIGGGSSLDVAKLVAMLAPGKQRLAEVYGVDKINGPRLPLMLIPTTSGTGSEVTPISIVTTGLHEKMGVVSPVLLPDIAILDPELTLGLPSHITAATGIDAMVHAIEAHASASPNNNPISRALAEKALSLIGASILAVVRQGDNLGARSDMLLGSMLAGQAFANSPVAAVHALAYPLGGHFQIPHGLSNALVLPHVLRFNIEAFHQPYAELAPCVFPDLIRFDGKERALAFCDALANLSKSCGLQQSLREMNIPQSTIPKLAEDAMKQTRLLVNNPRALALEDVVTIYERAF